MPELTDHDIKAIHETHDKVIRIDTILGNSGKGLIHDVSNNKKKIERIQLILVSIVSSGALGGGILGLVKMLTN